MASINIYEAKTHLSQLVDRAAAGEEIIIARNGRPVARLVPIAGERNRRVFGSMKGRIHLAPDFDELPEDLLHLFEGEEKE